MFSQHDGALAMTTPPPSGIRGHLRGCSKGPVIVTGGAHGIGRAICERLVARGESVVIADRDALAARNLGEQLQADGGDVIAKAMDVGLPESVEELVATAAKWRGPAAGLVNDAGIFAVVPVERKDCEDIEVAEWDEIMRINLRGVWLCARAVLPGMKNQGFGSIVNISSAAALLGTPGFVHYVASKAGVMGFTRALAREVGDAGIRINCVAPGRIETSELHLAEGDNQEARVERAVSGRALSRPGVAKDVVGAVEFLLGPDSDFITGQTLVVDGGSYMV